MTTTMRDAFATTVTHLLDVRDDVALVLADIGVNQFADTGALSRHPDRVINVGIREQLMIGVAAGFALEGFRPIAHSYTPFLIERPFEQIKLDFAHQGTTAVLVSIGASYDSTSEGRTHQSPGDVALMGSLPEWTIQVPGHADEAAALVRSAVASDDSRYIRLAKSMNAEPHPTRNGAFATIRIGGPDAPLVIAVGPMLDPTLEAVADMDATVLYASTVRPFDSAAVTSSLASGDVVLVEPYLAGTSAAAVAATLAAVPHRLLALGVPSSEHRHYGTVAEHDMAHGLDPAGLRRRIDAFVSTR